MSPTLVRIATGHHLAPDAAASYGRLCADYGATVPVTSAWRSREEQARLRERYLAGDGPFALPPGQSVHEIGGAVDFGAGARLWLALNAAAHGWVRTNPDEWWHREYRAARDQHRDRATPPAPPAPPAPTSPTPDPFLEDIMERLIFALYRTLLGRGPAEHEVDDWLVTAASDGVSAEQLADRFPGSPAEPATVVKAYKDYLGRGPNPGEVDSWLAAKPTIGQVRAGVGGSAEAKSRR